MTIKRYRVSIATDGSGDYSGSLQNCSGLLCQVRYVVDGSNPLATGADLTITEDDTGLNLLTMANIGTSSFTRSPREFAANPADGVVGTTDVGLIAIKGDLTLTIAQGGATNVGVIYVYIKE